MAFRWTHLALVVFFALFLGFPFWAYQGFTKDFGIDGAANPEWVCVKDLASGRLYQGQPRCGQGPVHYWVLWGVQSLSGSDVSGAVRFAFVALNLGLLGLTWALAATRRVPPWVLLLLGVLYVSLVYVPSLQALSSLLATTFFVAGVYVVFHTALRARAVVAGGLFGLAMLSKFTVAYPLAVVVLAYLWRAGAGGSTRTPRVVAVGKAGILLAAPVAGLVGLAFWLHPSFLAHSLWAHGAFPSHPSWLVVFQRVLAWWTFSWRNDLLFAVAVPLGVYAWLRERDLHGAVAALGLLGTFVALYWGHATPDRGLYYFSAALPFFLVLLGGWLSPSHSRRRRILTGLIMGLLILVFASRVVVEVQAVRLEQLVGAPLADLPVGEGGRVLVEGDHDRLAWYPLPVQAEAVWSDAYDFKYATGLEQLGLLNLSTWRDPDVWAAYPRVVENLQTGTYEAIVIAPRLDRTVVQKLVRLAHLTSPGDFPYQCGVYVPTLEERCPDCRHTLLVLFREERLCVSFTRDLLTYYEARFDDICMRDATVATQIGETLRANNVSFPRTCSSSGSLLTRYAARDQLWGPPPDFALGDADLAMYACPRVVSSQQVFVADQCTLEDLRQGRGSRYCTLCTEESCELYLKGFAVHPFLREAPTFFEQAGWYGCPAPGESLAHDPLREANPLKEYDQSERNACYQRRGFLTLGILPCTAADLTPAENVPSQAPRDA